MLVIFIMNFITFTKINTIIIKKKNSLNIKNKTKPDYKKLRLTDDYEYLSEEEKKTIINLNAFKEWIIKKEANINSELYRQYFNYQTPSALLNDLHNLKDNPLKIMC